MAAGELVVEEREEIRAGLARGDSCRRIAAELGRHYTTVCREVDRTGGAANYSALRAQRRAEEQKKRPKIPKLVADPELAALVVRHLKKKRSPGRISFEFATGVYGFKAHISHETIYQAIYRGLVGDVDAGLCRNLHLKRRKRKRRNRKVPGSHALGIFCRIHDRPEAADKRREVGHLEGDQIVGPYNRSAMLTVIDRKSRFIWLARLPNGKGAKDTTRALLWLLGRIPAGLRKTLTWDQGAELAHHPHIALTAGIEIYIADPKKPWQRPSNERANSEIRDHVGHDIDLSTYTNRQLRRIEHELNTKPRPNLGNATAASIYHQAVAMTH
jgi:IS30 family transposase